MKLLSSVLILFLAGCAGKPEIITKVEYLDVLVPVKCITKMPAKPNHIKDDPVSAKELMGYLLTCEELLKGCADEK